eukprot:scaffold4326_cov121-Cylindrotheca_fusiformis.AAC.3
MRNGQQLTLIQLEASLVASPSTWRSEGKRHKRTMKRTRVNGLAKLRQTVVPHKAHCKSRKRNRDRGKIGRDC